MYVEFTIRLHTKSKEKKFKANLSWLNKFTDSSFGYYPQGNVPVFTIRAKSVYDYGYILFRFGNEFNSEDITLVVTDYSF